MTLCHLSALANSLDPDPDLPVDQWSDIYQVIPKDSGANEYGKFRTSRTPHARMVMQALSDYHPCKRVVLMGASQMLKTQTGLNWLMASIHQSPANFLWILPTGKLAKRASTRIAKNIAAVPEVADRVAAPRSRDSVNTLDTKEYIGGALFIVTAGAAANLSEVPARRVLFDEVDRAELNVNGEGDPVALAEARQTTFERNRKSYFPSSPTIKGESIIESLYQRGTQRDALADCLHCGEAQVLEFDRLTLSEDGQSALYPCMHCGAIHTESDKPRMFARGAWTDGVAGDGETESFTISGLYLPYGWLPWLALMREYTKAKAKLEEGSEEAMIAFYNTRLAQCWERTKETTRYEELMNRAGPYKLTTVPAGGLVLTAAIDTQAYRLEFKVVAWGEGMECWIVDYQVIHSAPSESETWDKADALLKGRYRHASGAMMTISAAFVDSGGSNTQDVYNFTSSRKRRNIFAVKGHSRPNRPIVSAKPSQVDVSWRGKIERQGAQLWMIGPDTAKDYLMARWKKTAGPGAVHFAADLPESYYKGLTSEFRTHGHKLGRKVSRWELKKGEANEPLDLMVYNLGAAYYLGLHKKSENGWQVLRDRLSPLQGDLLAEAPPPPPQPQPQPVTPALLVLPPTPATNAPPAPQPMQPTPAPPPPIQPTQPTRPVQRLRLNGNSNSQGFGRVRGT